MATYNVNMKQFNGTSFDDVLPLAYNSQLFDDKTYADVSANIYQLAKEYTDSQFRIISGAYLGTGTSGADNPNSISADGRIVAFAFPFVLDSQTSRQWFFDRDLSTSYQQRYSYSNAPIQIKLEDNEKTVKWYATEGKLELLNAPTKQANIENQLYPYLLITTDTGITRQLFTSNGTFTVPETGNYNIEIHSVGGIAQVFRSKGYAGGGSGQLFKNIALTAGQTFDVVVGKYGTSNLVSSFGDYTVAVGGDAYSSGASYQKQWYPGAASGNIASAGDTITKTDQQASSTSPETITDPGSGSGNGSQSTYGHGGGIVFKKVYDEESLSYFYNADSVSPPTDGCVYIYKVS